MKYQAYGLHNFLEIPQIEGITENYRKAIKIVGSVLPFKTNNYITEELIIWDKIDSDPIFRMNFPQKEMLKKDYFTIMEKLYDSGSNPGEIKKTANLIRMQMNPHPAGQRELNTPRMNNKKLWGVQHKYSETVLFFPIKGQTCHAYCTFCFRWPQFVGISNLKMALASTQSLIEYLRSHREVTDILVTGGDPLVMKSRFLSKIIDQILQADLSNIRNIRIGSKALSWWPYRFLTDDDADELLRIFEKVNNSGKRLALMAHINHPREMVTRAFKEAVKRILKTGTQIRSQAPILKNINDRWQIWQRMWRKQVNLGIIPYYMFIPRNTGAQHYFAVPLAKALENFRNAYSSVSGLCRTVRGPIMSASPGKIQILGTKIIQNEKAFILQFIQGRNPDWVLRPFFARYDENAIWRNDLKPVSGAEKFFYEE